MIHSTKLCVAIHVMYIVRENCSVGKQKPPSHQGSGTLKLLHVNSIITCPPHVVTVEYITVMGTQELLFLRNNNRGVVNVPSRQEVTRGASLCHRTRSSKSLSSTHDRDSRNYSRDNNFLKMTKEKKYYAKNFWGFACCSARLLSFSRYILIPFVTIHLAN